MYRCRIMTPEEEMFSKKLRFISVVSDKDYRDFFGPKVIQLVGPFHEALELWAERLEKIPEPLGRGAEDGLRIAARRLIPESEDCNELNRLLKAKVEEGDLEESKKDEARFVFILTFIGDHKLH